MRRPLAGDGEVAWRKYAESLEERHDFAGLISFRLTRIEEALGITDGRKPHWLRDPLTGRPGQQWTPDGPLPSAPTWGRADLPPSA